MLQREILIDKVLGATIRLVDLGMTRIEESNKDLKEFLLGDTTPTRTKKPPINEFKEQWGDDPMDDPCITTSLMETSRRLANRVRSFLLGDDQFFQL